MQSISDFFCDLLFRLRNGGKDRWNIVIESGEVTLLKNNRSKHILNFSDVVEISTYKRDLVTVDSVCLFFKCSDGSTLEFTEEMTGFNDLSRAATSYFDLDKTWKDKVTAAPFATNFFVLWSIKKH